jgi:RNA polymerase sigma-70 factor, ECF subfamily
MTDTVTQLLQKSTAGNRNALDELLPLVYDELRRVASRQLAGERKNHTLQATALVHEAYLRLIGQNSVDWQNRLHFFSLAAEMMRRILVNHAIAKKAEKRGSGAMTISLDEIEVEAFPQKQDIDLVLLDETLQELAIYDAQQAKIVELKFFGGLTNEEIANVLDISESTIKREWRSAKAWLLAKIKE